MHPCRVVAMVMSVMIVLISAVMVGPTVEWAIYQFRASDAFPTVHPRTALHIADDLQLSSMSVIELQLHHNRLMELQDQLTAVSTVCLPNQGMDIHGRALAAPLSLTVEAVETQLWYVDQLRAVSPLGRGDEWPLAHEYLRDHFSTFPNQVAYLAALKRAQAAASPTTGTGARNTNQFTVIVQVSKFVTNSILAISRQLYFFTLWAQQHMSNSLFSTSSKKTKWMVMWGDRQGEGCCATEEVVASRSRGGGAVCVHRRFAPHDICSNISIGKDCITLSVQYMLDAHAVIPMHEKAVLINFIVMYVVGSLCFYLVVKSIRMGLASARLRAFAEASGAKPPTQPDVVDTGTQLTQRGPRGGSTGSTDASPPDTSRSPFAMSETIAMLPAPGVDDLDDSVYPQTPTSPSPPPKLPLALVTSASPSGGIISTSVTTDTSNGSYYEEEVRSPTVSVPRSSMEARERLYVNRRWHAGLYTILGLVVVAAIPASALLVESLGMADSLTGYVLSAFDAIVSGFKYIFWFVQFTVGLTKTATFVAAKSSFSSFLHRLNPLGSSDTGGLPTQTLNLVNAGKFIFLPRLYPELNEDGNVPLTMPDSQAVAPVVASLVFLNGAAMVCVRVSSWLFKMAKKELTGQYTDKVKDEVNVARLYAEASLVKNRSPARGSSPQPSPPRGGGGGVVPQLQLKSTSC